MTFRTYTIYVFDRLLNCGRRFFGGGQRCGKGAIEFLHQRHPVPFAFGDVVQLRLHLRGEIYVDQIGEILHQHIVDDDAGFGGMVTARLTIHITALFNRRENRRIRRRSADAVFFHCADERRVGVTRRRLGEVLLRPQADQVQNLIHSKRRDLLRLLRFAILRSGFFIDDEETGKAQRRT